MGFTAIFKRALGQCSYAIHGQLMGQYLWDGSFGWLIICSFNHLLIHSFCVLQRNYRWSFYAILGQFVASLLRHYFHRQPSSEYGSDHLGLLIDFIGPVPLAFRRYAGWSVILGTILMALLQAVTVLLLFAKDRIMILRVSQEQRRQQQQQAPVKADCNSDHHLEGNETGEGEEEEPEGADGGEERDTPVSSARYLLERRRQRQQQRPQRNNRQQTTAAQRSAMSVVDIPTADSECFTESVRSPLIRISWTDINVY